MMNRFNTFVGKINFKKTITVYLIVSILAGVLSVGFLAYTFRDKLALVYEYHRISEKADDHKREFENLKPELTHLANQSSDMVDILILDDQNKILFSAKNSDLSKKGSLELTANSDRGSHFLTDLENPDVHFRLLKGERLALSLSILGIENEVEQEYEDQYFYEGHFSTQKIYLLSYITDRSSGNKIYFISDVQPVANGKLYVKAVAALAMLFFMLYWVLLALWVYAKALETKLNAPLWGIIALFTNLAGLFIFLICRQGPQTCYKCGALQNKTNLYCTFCGTRINKSCDACGGLVGSKDAFCRTCGTKQKQHVKEGL